MRTIIPEAPIKVTTTNRLVARTVPEVAPDDRDGRPPSTGVGS